MPLFNLLERPFTDGGLLIEEWTFSHWQDHLEIIKAIQTQKSTVLIPWMIWPFNKDNAEDWLLKHQQLHDDMNSTLNLQGVDLENLDFQDVKAMEVWIDVNYREHLSARSILAI